jgi:plasmid maintenance system antidote protein VapI
MCHRRVAGSDHAGVAGLGSSVAITFLLEDFMKRLGTYFRLSPETWLGLQMDYDLRVIRRREGDRIVRSVRTRPAA